MISGIYAIINMLDGKLYVGQAFNFKKRWTNHVAELRLFRHTNIYLQLSWSKNTENNFIFIILERVEADKDLLTAREDFWMKKYDSQNRERGYNLAPAGGSMLGYKHTEETKKAWSDQRKGRKRTDAEKAAISAGSKGRIHSPETLEKMRLAKLGTKHSVESREARSKAMMGDQRNKGRKQSDSQIEARVEKLKGQKRTPEQRARMSESNMGRVASPETREKQRIAALKRWNKNPA